MHTFVHLFIGIIAMIALRLHGWPAVLFVLAAVFIDADHIIELAHGVSNIRRKYVFDVTGFREANYRGVQRSMHIFHTFEFLTGLFIASAYYLPLFYIALSFSVHMLTDAWGNFWNRNIKKKGGADWIKYCFLAYYIRKGSVFNR